MKPIALILLTISALVVSQPGFQDAESNRSKTPEKLKPFMRAKLVGSQTVLDGLVTEDFGLIRHGAQNMKKMSEALQWPVAEDAVYNHHGQEFRRQCDKLIQLAEEKNLEGAHFTYLSMTTTCFTCHNYVRGKFRIERDSKQPQGPVRLIPTDWEGNSFRKQDRSADSLQSDLPKSNRRK